MKIIAKILVKTTNTGVMKIKQKNGHKVTSPNASSFDAWLESPMEKTSGRRCVTCVCGSETSELIRRFMQKRIANATRKPNAEFHRWLKATYNYPYTCAALNRHMRDCEDTLYREMRAADIRNGLVRGPGKLDAELGRPKER